MKLIKEGKNISFIAFVLFLSFSSSVIAQDVIQYVGSSTVGKFINEAKMIYTDVTFKVNTKPESGGGETATAAGKTDIGGVARDVKPQILAKGVNQYLIGKDAIGVWVNMKNPVNGLSRESMKKIFTGKITNWKEVGGKDLPITIYIVNPQSATRKVFSKIILGDERYGGKVKTIRPDPKIIDMVADDEGGIGQLSFALGDTHPKYAMTKKLTVGREKPSVNNPTYPITRPLYLITKGEPKPHVKQFIDWALSAKGQAVVKKYFVGR